MPKRPGICYILPSYNPDTASHFYYLYEFIEYLKEDLDIFVVIEKSQAQSRLSVPSYIAQSRLPFVRFLKVLAILFRERFRGRRFFYVHYSFYGGLAAWVVTRLCGGRVYYWNCGMPWQYARSRAEEALFRFILRNTRLVTGTESLKEAYARHYGLLPDRIHVVPNWIKGARFASVERIAAKESLAIAPELSVILFVHRLSRRKGVHHIPDIVERVIEKTRQVLFVIVGAGPEEKWLRETVRMKRLESFVRITGGQPNREISKFFNAADIFLMPSEEEGFPHVLLEAEISGIPFVASDVGGVREITPPELRKYLVQSQDPKEYAGHILDLLNGFSVERERLGAIEQEWVKRYDLSVAADLFKKLFQ